MSYFYNSGVGKYRTNLKNTILLTLASVNIFAKNTFEEEIFYVIFFLVYPLLLFALFRWKLKKKNIARHICI
jgi:hypothetical protein